MKIEIIGERKTGTNYVKEMIKRHFSDYVFVQRGWKHRLIKVNELEDDILYVICTKNPYSWLQSLYEKPYHMIHVKDLSFSKFLRAKANDFEKTQTYPNSIKMWNQKYYRYKMLLESDYKTFLIRHEDVIENYRAVFMRLHKEHGIRLVKRLTNIKNHVGDLGIMRYGFNSNKYGAILSGDKQFIQLQLNNKLAKYFNY